MSSANWNRSQNASGKTDLFNISRSYIEKMLDVVPGYKALLVDRETLRILSTALTQTELGAHDVFCTERVDTHDSAQHSELKAICFLRPTRENITHLKRELRKPRFQQYFMFFTNMVKETLLTDLAEIDAEKEVVEQVQEFYADYVVLDGHHFCVPMKHPSLFLSPGFGAYDGQRGDPNELSSVDRMTQGLSALLLSLRRRPVIRYQNGSDVAVRLSLALYHLIYHEERSHFDFGLRGNESPPLLLIIDRKDDPVTPLLTQWTYQAMIHELVGISDNKVQLKKTNIPKDQAEAVLAPQIDPFFRKHMYSNYGDLGIAVKELMDSFQGNAVDSQQLKTIEDMRRFLLNYGDFSQQQRHVTRHVNIVSVLSEEIGKRSLMETSEVEQDLACSTGTSASVAQDAVLRVLINSGASRMDKLRLVMLYALRFENDRERIRQLTYRLELDGLEDHLIQCVNYLLRYAGKSRRRGDLYGTRSVFSYARKMAKAFKGIENVYTQHAPLLNETLRLVNNNDLSTQDYPYASETGAEVSHWQGQYKKSAPKEVIVFIVGGTTYEEAKAVHELNERSESNLKVWLGGTTVLNSTNFIEMLMQSSRHGGSRMAPLEIMKDVSL